MSLDLLVLTHLAATLYMVGLIWFVQRVHYPLFARVGAEHFQRYEQDHVARTSPVVGPPMLVEAFAALALAALLPSTATWLGLALLGLIWLSTALLQVPRHRELSEGFGAHPHQSLVATNWIRTAAWSARGVVAVWLAFEAMQPGIA